MRITEQTPHSGSGPKAGKGVCIDQTTWFASSWHPAIMPNFGPAARALGSWEYRGLRVMAPRFLPTLNHEDPFLFQRLDFVTAGGTLKRSDSGCWLPTQGR